MTVGRTALITVVTLITAGAGYFAYEAVTHRNYVYGLMFVFLSPWQLLL